MLNLDNEHISILQQSPPIDEGSSQPLTVNKTVLNLDIPLHNSGPAGLGVTVYAKSTSSRVGGEMGVYIKSIVPGGAAAMVSVVTMVTDSWLSR